MEKSTQQNLKIQDFSEYLFWDIDVDKLDFQKSKKWLIGRVLEYGNLNDWKKLLVLFGREVIKKEVVNIRSLDAVTLSFLSVYFSLEKEDFRCYSKKQSTPDFWNS